MALNNIFNFNPEAAISITCSVTATAVAFSTACLDFRIANISGQTIHFRLGGATVAAATTDTAMTNGTQAVFRRNLDLGQTTISVRTASGTGTIQLSEGQGS